MEEEGCVPRFIFLVARNDREGEKYNEIIVIVRRNENVKMGSEPSESRFLREIRGEEEEEEVGGRGVTRSILCLLVVGGRVLLNRSRALSARAFSRKIGGSSFHESPAQVQLPGRLAREARRGERIHRI